MKRHWLLFSQVVTVLLAIWFVVATLKPDWLNRRAGVSGVTLLEAAPSSPGVLMPGSLSPAAKRAAPAVVSIATTQAKAANPQQNDPWFRFFYGEREDEGPQMGLGSGVIVSPEGYILTNNHVIDGADEIEVTLSDSRRAIAKVIGTDPDSDLAILKITLDKLPAIVLGTIPLAVIARMTRSAMLLLVGRMIDRAIPDVVPTLEGSLDEWGAMERKGFAQPEPDARLGGEVGLR